MLCTPCYVAQSKFQNKIQCILMLMLTCLKASSFIWVLHNHYNPQSCTGFHCVIWNCCAFVVLLKKTRFNRFPLIFFILVWNVLCPLINLFSIAIKNIPQCLRLGTLRGSPFFCGQLVNALASFNKKHTKNKSLLFISFGHLQQNQ